MLSFPFFLLYTLHMLEEYQSAPLREKALDFLRKRIAFLNPQYPGQISGQALGNLLDIYDLAPDDTRFTAIETEAQSGEFHYEDFYQQLKEKLGEEEVVLKLIADYGEEAGLQMYQRVRKELGNQFAVLLIEPALATKHKLFIDFCKKRNLSAPEQTRSEFIAYLNKFKVKLYRSMALTDQELATVQQEGMKSGLLRSKANGKASRSIVGSAFSGLDSIATSHLSSFTNSSTLISFSKYPEMAQRASRSSSSSKLTEGAKSYIFEVEVNPFYLLKFNGLLKNTLGDEKFGYGKSVDGTWIVNGKAIAGDDTGIELFTEWVLPPQAIVNVSPIESNALPEVQFKKADQLRVFFRKIRRAFTDSTELFKG